MLKGTHTSSVLVTGISGFLGTAMAQALAERGFQVTGLSRRRPLLPEGVAGIRWVEGSILDKELLERSLEGVEYVFHMAAYAKPWAADPEVYERINVEGSRRVMEACLKAGVQKVIYTSTAGVMNPSGSTGVTDEKCERTIPYSTLYESSKAKAEKRVLEYAAKGPEVVVVNPSRVFGMGAPSESNGVTKMIRLYLQGKFRILPGRGTSIGNYVHIDDVVKGHLLALEKGKNGTRYILGGENVSYREFFSLLAEVSGRKRMLFPLPVPLMMFLSYLMLMHARLTGRLPLITPPWIQKYNYHWALSSDLARNELGYDPMSLREGLRKTIAEIS